MDEDYRRPVKVNRYWNRPKPKVYDCNMRDAERLYKSSYNEYLAEKDFRTRRSREWSDTSDRFSHLRAGPVRRREASQDNVNSSTLESILQRVQQHKEERAREAAEEAEASVVESIPERKPIPAYDPQKENQSLEERLARLKRLREDLGLPNDTESSKTTLRESRDSASRTFGRDSASRTFASENESSYKSRSRAGAAASSDESSYRSERSSKVNGTEDYKVTPKAERKREEIKVTPKAERKSYASKAESKDDYSFKSEKKAGYSKLSATSASSSSPSRTIKKSAAATESLELDDEDDALMAKMMKKLPSSQEILERISKMDLDD